MNRFLLAFFVLAPFIVSAQEQQAGIQFASESSWAAVLARAKVENKYIFLDCYTTWCGPCKWMSKNIYPQKEVGDFFNAHFISVAVQMDKTAKDSANVRTWYRDADSLSEAYNINFFPSYLFFSPDGIIVHRSSGSTEIGRDFIAKAAEALDPQMQYYTLLKEWKEHRNDSIYLSHILNQALAISDKENAIAIGQDYIPFLERTLIKDNVILISRLYKLNPSFNSSGFQFLLENGHQIDELMNDTTYVERIISNTAFDKEVIPLLVNDENPIKWNDVSGMLKKKYPILSKKFIDISYHVFQADIAFDVRMEASKDSGRPDWGRVFRVLKSKYSEDELKQILLEQEIVYYGNKQLWTGCEKACYQLLRQYGVQLEPVYLNTIAWDDLFLHCDNQRILREIIKWMKQSIERGGSSIPYENIDTYANLLFKNGHPKEAIIWEQKAIELAVSRTAGTDELKEFRSTLEKMSKRQPTWDVN